MSECVVLVNCLLEIGCLLKSMEALIGRRGRRKNIIQYVIIAIILGISVYINPESVKFVNRKPPKHR